MQTKKDLVETISAQLMVSRRYVRRVLEAFVQEVVRLICAGESVQLPRFGIFEPAKLSARKVFDFVNNHPVAAPERFAVRFRCSEPFRRLLRSVKTSQATQEEGEDA